MADDDEMEEEPEELDEDDEEAGSDDDEEDDDEEGEGKPRRKPGRMKLLLIIGGAVVFLLATGLGLFFSGILDPYLGLEDEKEVEEGPVQGKFFYKLEDITLNLNEEGKKSRFLKVGLTIVLVNEADVGRVELLRPRIASFVSAYLRELRPEEMSGSADFYRLRENVLLRVRTAVAPIQVTNVLFNSVLVQ